MDNEKAVKASQDAATDEGVKTDQPAPTGEVDYAAELAALVDENTRITRDRDNYRQALLVKKGKKPADDKDESGNDGTVADEIAAKVLEKALPLLERSTHEESISSLLNDLSSNADERKLILYHFDNSVGTQGSLRDRLENAQLIANKKSILKANSELKVALHNRAQLGNTGHGSNTEDTQKVGDTFFTADQLAYFKKRKLDPETVKANLLRYKR